MKFLTQEQKPRHNLRNIFCRTLAILGARRASAGRNSSSHSNVDRYRRGRTNNNARETAALIEFFRDPRFSEIL